jgi:hypothetical protein
MFHYRYGIFSACDHLSTIAPRSALLFGEAEPSQRMPLRRAVLAGWRGFSITAALSSRHQPPSHPKVLSMRRVSRLALFVALGASLGACAHHHRKNGPKLAALAPARITTLGTNAYLWRAALDTFSFMTIHQTDSNGGVISTEWYVNPALPGERMKISVSILDSELRADAVRVSAARQILQGGQWVDTAVQAGTNQKLEEIVLQKARDLRRSTVGE